MMRYIYLDEQERAEKLDGAIVILYNCSGGEENG